MSEISISDFVDQDLKPYSIYTIYFRAIPHMIDSFKPSQRKIIYTALKKARKNYVKVASLAGYTVAEANFHHGPDSLAEAISGMVAEYSNNVPVLEGDGSFGSRLVPEPSSPRYTFARLSNNFDKIFLDHEIAPESEDPEDPEPAFYLPTMPMVLVNGAKGIATGFATDIIPRDPNEVKEACKQYLDSGTVKELTPAFPQFNGNIWKDKQDDQWYCSGTYNTVKNNVIEITEVPIGFDRKKYVELLEKLKDKGKITDYEDRCSSEGFEFEVKLAKNFTANDENIIKEFQLRKKLNENITVIDQNGKLRIFDSAEDLLKEFCDYRLSMYEERYKYYIQRDTEKMDFATAKKQMIQKVNNGEIDLKNNEKKDLKKFFFNNVLPNKMADDYYADRLLDTPIHHFTTDYVKKLTDYIEQLKEQIEEWKNKDRREAFKEDLEAIK